MELWAHQKLGIERALETSHFGFFFEAGTGKTRTVIDVLRHRMTQSNRYLKTIILAPQVVCPNWKAEFLKFSKIPGDMILVLDGTGKQRLEKIKETKAQIIICNYQTLLMAPVFKALQDWGPEVAIADESHRIKNYKAQTTRKAIELSGKCFFRYILSGTPILQNAMDVFSQFEFMDGGRTFGKNFFTFRRQYFTDLNAGLRSRSAAVTWAKWVPLKSREPELSGKISRLTLSVKKSECLDLPPYIRQRIEVPLSKEQTKAYEEMKRHMITFMKGEAVTASMALHKALRLQQIVSGFVGADDGAEHSFKEVPRLEALREILEDLCESNKVIVWACWRNNQQSIRGLLDKLGVGYREITGDSNASDREQSLKDFRERADVRVILGSQGAGGIGINLIEASDAVYFSRSFSLEHDVQSEARNYRGGSEMHEKITRIDLVSPGTIDDDVLEALSNKQEISERVIFKCLGQ
jgi:SNF2 family DNA or RNA helicase